MSYNRSDIHPLLRYDPDAMNGGIQVLKLEYFEAETTKAPVPRNQEVPENAFGELTGRSVLVATSHAWFHQCHPDPEGIKLEIMRKKFFPQLRKRFPHTQILIFDDWHSCPQWPRPTEEEQKRFRKCMAHMNSMYCYCDVVLFIEAPLPKLDDTVFSCKLVPSEHAWLRFIDTIQYVGDGKDVAICKNNIVMSMNDIKVDSLTIDVLKKMKEISTISFLKRPYGRPNRTPADERGWLYAERITVAMRMAAAKEETFDDVVMSNEENLYLRIRTWSRALRSAAEFPSHQKERTIQVMLESFEAVLYRMKFTVPSDTSLVRQIMHDVVNKFKTNWKEESRRQDDISKRAREMLLRWGEFSKEYVERAGFLKRESDNLSEMLTTFGRMITLLSCPISTLCMFWFDVPQSSKLFGSLFLAAGTCFVPLLVQAPLKFEFLKFPIGTYIIFDIVQTFIQAFVFSFLLRILTGLSPVPFEFLWTCILCVTIGNKIVFGPKLIRTTNPRTKRKIRVSLKMYCDVPAKFRFDPKTEANVKLIIQFSHFSYVLGFLYPILGGVFFNSGVLVQSCIVPLFYVIRAAYEYGADVMNSKTFGSDGMPIVCLAGVGMHEVCLTLMMTSISHPLIFTMLILCDVFENAFCLWSLHRTIHGVGNKVVPTRHDNDEVVQRKTMRKRSSSVYKLVRDLDSSMSANERRGTSLFIASTLLQRELVETFVPMQAMAIISILYSLDVKSNSVVSRWKSIEEYNETMLYIGIDLAVEIFVFMFTILTLRIIFPDVSAWRVLSGLLKNHLLPMSVYMCGTWYFALLFQSTQTGMDPTLRFSWLKCDDAKENSTTWVGGFDYEC